MKNILVLVHDDSGQEARLQAALDVTRAIGGHLTCLDVVTIPAGYADAMAGPTIAMVLDDERAREDQHCTKLKERLSHEDVPWDLRQVTDDVLPAIRRAADLADLIVLNSRFQTHPHGEVLRVAGEAAVDADRPVLAVPEDCRRLELEGTVLIAWDGSQEAIESLRSAVPLLKLASDVILFHAQTSRLSVPATEAAAYLSRHGVACTIAVQPAESDVTEAILRAAQETDAGYIVMGAFGHGRLREALFGGITRSMLEESEFPLFLTH